MGEIFLPQLCSSYPTIAFWTLFMIKPQRQPTAQDKDKNH